MLGVIDTSNQRTGGNVIRLAILAMLLPISAHAQANSAASATGSPRTLVVCGIDRSGSAFTMVRAGMRLCSLEIAAAGPGTLIVIKWIAERSFAASATALRIRIPDAAANCGSLYDVRCRRTAQVAKRAGAAARREGLRRLMSLHPRPAANTDLQGFLAAAALEMEGAGPTRYRLVFASDLQSTVRQTALPQLPPGVEVKIGMLQIGNDVGRSSKLRSDWTRDLTQRGATSVTIVMLDAGETR